ncbi:MAG: galactokinase [Cryomorphaceae bacterium]|jgi:galactokinase|nr:galactokinase [Cryomorphaceae bacterium]
MQQLKVIAPGRINLLGEHLDYNQGVVLPAAINRFFEFEFKANTTDSIHVEALDLNESWEFELHELEQLKTTGWKSYVKGVFILMGLKSVNGLHIRFKSNIPIGAGLSSSAALCCGLAFGLNEFFDLGKTRFELALLAQQTEHQYAGVKCGLMDQVACLLGEEAHLLAFDTLHQSIQTFSLPLVGVQLFLIDSKVKHNLAASAYNERRSQLEEAWNLAQQIFVGIESWRSLNPFQFKALLSHLDAVSIKRLTYVLDEMSRVQKVQALAKQIAADLNDSSALNDSYQELGHLLNQTHDGLRDLYEVSCEEIDFLQCHLQQTPGILGARMMGGGFGGCLLVLAKADFNFHSLEAVFTAYQLRYRQNPSIEPIQLMGGVRVL